MNLNNIRGQTEQNSNNQKGRPQEVAPAILHIIIPNIITLTVLLQYNSYYITHEKIARKLARKLHYFIFIQFL